MRSAAAAALVGLLAGCAAVGPDYRRPAIALPAAFEQAGDERAPLPLRPDWWALFGDADLDALVQRGRERNTDLRIAAARIDEAEAVVREARSANFPQIDLGGRASRAHGTASSPAGTRGDYQLVASTSFELDFWGRLRRTEEGARAQLLATRFARDVADLSIAGSIAQTYFAIRSLDAQIAVVGDTVQARTASLDIVRARFRAGVVSALDVNQAEGALADALAQRTDLLRQREVLEHALGQLVGAGDLRLDVRDLRSLAIPVAPPPGLPASLIERRPDVRQAEQQLAAANAAIGVARAAQLPTFSLTGSLGAVSTSLADVVLSPGRLWSLALGMAMPVIDSGRYAARTAQAEARRRQALGTWQKSAETAFREVADALSNVRRSAEVEADLEQRADRARNSLRLAQLRYRAGYSAFIEVLDAQRTVNEAELALIRNRQSRLAFTVDLMRALGGGWTAERVPDAATRAAAAPAPTAVPAPAVPTRVETFPLK